MKVKVRIQGTQRECNRLRRILLKKHPELILGKPRKGTNPKYAGNQKYSCYGDYWSGKVRRRRSD